MILAEILQSKGRKVHTIGPHATLGDAVQELVRRNIGSLIVCEESSSTGGARILGMITERDILRVQAAQQTPLATTLVAEIMTTNLITVSPQDPIERAMWLMTEHRVRHLPIVEGGRLDGVISIGDVVKAHHDQLEMENHFMRNYIQGADAESATP